MMYRKGAIEGGIASDNRQQNSAISYAYLFGLLFVSLLFLAGCGPSTSEQDVLATSAAAAIEAQVTELAKMTEIAGTLIPIPDTGVTPTPIPTAIPPTNTPLPSPTATLQPTVVPCANVATLERDVTYPDLSNVKPSVTFEKIWRIKNTGTCTWTTAYTLAFVSGAQMGGPAQVQVPAIVAPGESIDLKVSLKSPSTSGIYTGNWKLKTAAGVAFGVGADGEAAIDVKIVVGDSGTTVTGAWKGEYFDNKDLKKEPKFTRLDAEIDFNWKKAAPASSLPRDRFSIRWTGDRSFEMGTYRFIVTADDRVRLYVDDVLVIDAWENSGVRDLKATVSFVKGTHDIKLEYSDRGGKARVGLSWKMLKEPTFDDWRGRYFSNRKLNGDPILVRNDEEINFNWRKKSPADGVPKDNFSVRWTRNDLTFTAGTYRFYAKAEGGIRVYVDGKLLIDEWNDNSNSTIFEDTIALDGEHKLKVEYFTKTGKALVKVWYEKE